MVGLVVVTHGGAADCLLDAVAGILGALPAAVPVSVSMDETFDDTLARIERACDQVDAVVITIEPGLYIARDAAELVAVEYAPLPAVTNAEAALATDAPPVPED